MVMATQEPPAQPESPLDVLSRAASLVESGASESDSAASPSPPRPQLHPKFRRGHETMAATPPPPYSHAPAVATRGSPEEAPLDFSIRKRSLSPHQPGPPPYKYSNPLRQHSPPGARASQSPPAPAPASSHQLPVNPAPSYYRPPPYPRTPSPPPAPPPSHSQPQSARPPPPSYEAAMASKPTSPRVSLTTTSPTFMTLTTRPSPTSKSGVSEYSVSALAGTSPTTKTDLARPSVICTGPAAGRKEDLLYNRKEDLPVVNLFKKEENKENKDNSDTQRSRKREVTIVEG